MRQTVVGIFDHQEAASAALEALARSGFDRTRIRVTQTHSGATASVVAAGPPTEDGVLSYLRHFFAEVFGGEHDVSRYAQALRGGGAVVQVDVDDQSQAPHAELALVRAGAADITHRSHATPRADGAARGMPADALALTAGAGPLAQPEVSDSAFEPYDAAFRSDYQRRYAALGGAYENYRPAYRYGHALASQDPAPAGRWEEVEEHARRGWEKTHPGTVWDDVKAGVRHAWESVTR